MLPIGGAPTVESVAAGNELSRAASDRAELAELKEQFRSYGLAIPVPTAATYDNTTEGKTGLRFVLTRRWLVYFAAAVVFVGSLVAAAVWQVGQWQQINAYNSTVVANYGKPVAPLDSVLPTLHSFRSADQWLPVSVSGTYSTAQQLVVRNRTCANIDGSEVLTPLRTAAGNMFLIDRGCVEGSVIPSPPSGVVSITAHVVVGESYGGRPAGNQLESIDLPQIASMLGAPTYTGAYGLLVSQEPASKALEPVISGRPILDSSGQSATTFAIGLYLVVGLVIFGAALREKFRWVNRFDPRLWRRELKRIQRLARKKFSEEELEDQWIDRGTGSSVAALGAGSATDRSGEGE